MANVNDIAAPHRPWNKGRLIGQKPPLKLKEIWPIRIRLQIANKVRELAIFNIAIDSKLRACEGFEVDRRIRASLIHAELARPSHALAGGRQ